MTTTTNNYTPDPNLIHLWLTEPNLFAYLDRRYSFENVSNWDIFSDIIRHSRQRVLESGWTPPSEAAFPLDARDIPNGRYILHNPDGSTIYYQIYTVQSGQWAGRRVIKMKSSSRYSAFAFLNADHGWTLWSRFNDRQREPFIEMTSFLLESIQQAYLDREGYMLAGVSHRGMLDGQYISIGMSEHACRICNRPVRYHSLQLCTLHHPSPDDPVMTGDLLLLMGGVSNNFASAGQQSGGTERTIPLAYCEVTTTEIQ